MGIKQSERDFPRLTREAAGVIASVLERDRRVLLFGAPGVARGVAGSELLEGLAEATRAHVVLVITPTGKTPPLVDELRTLKQEVYLISAAEAAMRPGKRVRARARTAQWDGYLHTGITQSIDLDSVHVIGTPPPREEASVWTGRQIALIQAQHTLAMGEVQQLEGNQLTVTLPERVSGADTLLIRDAARTADGVIETAAPWTTERLHYLPPVDVLPSITVNNGPRLVGRVGSVEVALIGVILDHQGTEVVAYVFEPDRQINVRKDRLVARGLEPGPWLKELKQQLLAVTRPQRFVFRTAATPLSRLWPPNCCLSVPARRADCSSESFSCRQRNSGREFINLLPVNLQPVSVRITRAVRTIRAPCPIRIIDRLTGVRAAIAPIRI